VLRRVAEGGWIGVDLFFVLSGFLVSSLLFREYNRHGSVDIKRFLIRRGFKIYPAFWLFLIFTLMMQQYLGEGKGARQVLGEILFLQNYLGGVWNHTWSLAVEEHFYIGLALLVSRMVAANRVQPFHRMPTVFALIAVLCFGFRLDNLAASPEYSHRAYLFGTHIRIDSLMFGVLLSYLWIFRDLQNRTVRIPSFALIAIGGLLLSPAFAFQLETNKWISIVGVIFFYLGAGVLVIAALRWETSESYAIRLIAGLGAASYSIYLWHMPVATWGHSFVAKLIGYDSYLLYLFNAVIGACAFGWVLSRLIENPILKLRDRFFPSQATPRIKSLGK
jgi:peptidoglycan/LPS O-acetylase OafA/YrhL